MLMSRVTFRRNANSVLANVQRQSRVFLQSSMRLQSAATSTATTASTSSASHHIDTSRLAFSKPVYNVKEAPTFHDYKSYFKALQQATMDLPQEIVSKSTKLNTLHARLSLPESFQLSTLSKCLNCRSSKLVGTVHDNFDLSILGKNILIYQVTKYLNLKYPRLPINIMNCCIDYLVGNETLHLLGKTVWGLEVEKTTVMSRFLKKEPVEQTLGRLRYYDNEIINEKGVELYKISQNNKVVSEEAAYSLAVKSIIGGLHLDTNFDSAIITDFIDQNLIRKIPIAKIFQFKEPVRELSRLCERENLTKPITKLISESGRLSKAPIFIVGVFSGEEKLGEGFGSSLKEAKIRAATDGLLKYYCYEPINSEGGIADLIDKGTVIV